MKISRKVLMESLVNVLKFGGRVDLINYKSNFLKLYAIMDNKKIMAKCLHNGIWSNYIYDLNYEGMVKCLKFITVEEIIGKKDLEFNPIGEESVVKFRYNLIKLSNKSNKDLK